MSTLFVDGAIAEDTWVSVDGDQPVPTGVDVIVSLDIFQEQREALLARNDGRLGVHLEPLEPLSEIEGDLDQISMVSLDFPSFANGTSFSKARLLRDRYGFEGEVRAVGDIRIDQVLFLKRCGCNAMVVDHEPTIKSLIEVKDPGLTLFYQPAAGDGTLGAGGSPITGKPASSSPVAGKAWARRA